jgi:hypothetical protein
MSESGWGNDDKGSPMIVVQQQPGSTDDAPVPGSRRGTAILWMGALLGGMFIAVIFLGLNYTNAVRDKRDLAEKAEKSQLDFQDLKQQNRDYRIYYEVQKRYITDLQNEIKALRGRKNPAPTPAPSQPDPFAPEPTPP